MVEYEDFSSFFKDVLYLHWYMSCFYPLNPGKNSYKAKKYSTNQHQGRILRFNYENTTQYDFEIASVVAMVYFASDLTKLTTLTRISFGFYLTESVTKTF